MACTKAVKPKCKAAKPTKLRRAKLKWRGNRKHNLPRLRTTYDKDGVATFNYWFAFPGQKPQIYNNIEHFSKLWAIEKERRKQECKAAREKQRSKLQRQRQRQRQCQKPQLQQGCKLDKSTSKLCSIKKEKQDSDCGAAKRKQRQKPQLQQSCNIEKSTIKLCAIKKERRERDCGAAKRKQRPKLRQKPQLEQSCKIEKSTPLPKQRKLSKPCKPHKKAINLKTCNRRKRTRRVAKPACKRPPTRKVKGCKKARPRKAPEQAARGGQCVDLPMHLYNLQADTAGHTTNTSMVNKIAQSTKEWLDLYCGGLIWK